MAGEDECGVVGGFETGAFGWVVVLPEPAATMSAG